MAYKLVIGGILRLADGARFPLNPDNRDYRDYLEWLAAGNTPQPEDPPPPPTKDQIDAAAAKGYAKLNALMQMSPDQVKAWVEANVTNLAQAQDAIATLAIAVSVIARNL